MKQKHYIIYDLLLKYKIMTIPFKNAFVLYSLNNYKTIAKSPEATKFNEIMNKYNDKSGDMFIKNMLIKCCELVIEQKLINATSKDIHINNNSSEIKLFIGKMINNLYENKIDITIPINTLYDTFLNEIITVVTKKELLIEIIKYINTIQNHELKQINNGKQLFTILVDVLHKLLLQVINEYLDGSGNTSVMFIKIVNQMYNYKSVNYNYDSSDSDTDVSSSDSSNSDSESLSNSDDGEEQPQNKRKLNDNITCQNKKMKTY